MPSSIARCAYNGYTSPPNVSTAASHPVSISVPITSRIAGRYPMRLRGPARITTAQNPSDIPRNVMCSSACTPLFRTAASYGPGKCHIHNTPAKTNKMASGFLTKRSTLETTRARAKSKPQRRTRCGSANAITSAGRPATISGAATSMSTWCWVMWMLNIPSAALWIGDTFTPSARNTPLTNDAARARLTARMPLAYNPTPYSPSATSAGKVSHGSKFHCDQIALALKTCASISEALAPVEEQHRQELREDKHQEERAVEHAGHRHPARAIRVCRIGAPKLPVAAVRKCECQHCQDRRSDVHELDHHVDARVEELPRRAAPRRARDGFVQTVVQQQLARPHDRRRKDPVPQAVRARGLGTGDLLHVGRHRK